MKRVLRSASENPAISAISSRLSPLSAMASLMD
ncbi:hypothetical protein SVIOM342S_03581 [Streptomyces violaceorubidus]